MKRATPAPRVARRRTAAATERILDAALVEFAQRGFEAASTNTIAREASVAKGLVFHHFGTKEDLYLAVVDRVTARVVEQVFAIDPLPADLFERLFSVAVQKLRVFQRDPIAYQFLIATIDAPTSLQARLEERRVAQRFVFWPRFLEGVDASRLRPGITLEQALDTLNILGLGIERRYLTQLARLPDRGHAQIEDLTRELWSHYDRLRHGLYTPTPSSTRTRRGHV